MTEHEASRTLVKSPPELWAELSDQSSLASHLAEPFGEIRIIRLEPEIAVAWEGERASGTVRIEPSGWGTRVTLTARAADPVTVASEPKSEPPPPEPDPIPLPVPDPEPLPAAAAEPPPAPMEPAPRPGFLGRLRAWLRLGPSPQPPPEEAVAAEPVEAPVATPPDETPGPGTFAARRTLEEPEVPEIDPASVLVGVLDRLGAAHRRPFSHT